LDDCTLEDNLLVSSPGAGGLVYLEGQSQVVLSTKSCTGICFGKTALVWAPQDNGGRYLLEAKNGLAKLVEISTSPLDIHDVLIAEDKIYLAATQNNEVICLDRNYSRIESWRLPGEEDSAHLNSIAIYQGQLIASVFGSFTRYREYKDGTSGLGKIFNVRTGETLIDGLSQPHSLTVADDLLYFCSSQEKKLHVYDGERIVNTVLLPGYARGVAVGEHCIYVGISLSRNIGDELHELASGAISILDKKSMKCIGIKMIPFREVYDIRIVSRHADLLSLVATVLTATPVFTTALYWEGSAGAGFNETNKLIGINTSEIENELAIDFNFQPLPGQKISKIRIDPVSEKKLVWIKSAKISNEQNMTLWEWTGKEGHSDLISAKWVDTQINNGKILSAESDDPQWYPEIPEETLQKITSGTKCSIVMCDDGSFIGSVLTDALSIQKLAANQEAAERDGQIASLNQEAAERDGQIASLNQEAAERQSSYQCHVIELETALGVEQQRYFLLTTEAANLRFQLNRIMVSRSWKLTSPLRRLSTLAHKVPAAFFRRAITIYRTLPITPLQRLKLKNIVFSIFGFAFVRMGAYQRWKEYRNIQTDWPTAEPVAEAAPVISMVSGTIAPLPSADGIWEWSAYNAVKSRISQIKAQQLSQVSPSPLDLINIGNESFASAATRVKLPALIAAPVVSIILPVFNNLKLTLECLLSITAHTDSRVSYEIILADDASTDETAQIVSAIPNLRIFRNESNLGFLLNCNKALEYAKGQYVMYLNNDVQVTKDWLFILYETFATHANVGAAGPRFLYPSGHLQEAGAAFRHDGTADMVGLNEEPEQPRYSYIRRVDYVSGACLMLPTSLARQLGGFSEDFLPCYCEDSDLCLRIQDAGYYVYCNPFSTVIHHLSKTTAAFDSDFKLKSISTNLVKLQHKWLEHFNKVTTPRIISFYLPQFHPFPENDSWWGNGFTEWTNVTKAQPNFIGHYQPRLPADLGFYDLRLLEIMQQQAELASRYGVSGFCFYYYWFGGKRLLETPLDQMLDSGKPDMPFCLCWANENWSRRWDGNDKEVLMAQSHSPEDDEAVINDLIRYFRDPRYICIDGKPLILIYRVTLFPNFSETATRWRNICREQGMGEIYIAMVESMELVHANKHPKEYGCDAAVEFPPQELAEQKIPSGERINPEFAGAVADYRDIAVRYATRKFPGYTRFKGVMPGWDNTARMQNKSFCFEHATPGALQAWLEETIEQTRQQHYGDERIVFVNAWNEWAEGAYLEPDRRFGHTYLEAVKNATEAANLLRRNKYLHGG